MSQLFNNYGSIKKWHEFKREYDLHENSSFQWVQLTDSIQEKKNFIIKKAIKLEQILIIKGSSVITLDKLTSSKIYSILILKVQDKPSSNIYFGNLFNDSDIDWAAIYILPCLATYNTYKRYF